MMQTYIIHVSTDLRREDHILKELEKFSNYYRFIKEGDKKALTPDILDRYFKGKTMHRVSAATSCAYKHILAYQIMIANEDALALILEDDIVLSSHFYEKFNATVHEIKESHLENFILSIEDSTLEYIPKSQRAQGVSIYPMNHGRTAGAYLIDRTAAINLLEELTTHKTDLPIDHFHNYCISQHIIKMYWRQPAIARQKSLNGMMPSLIDIDKYGKLRPMTYMLNRLYKKILYFFR